MHLSKDKVAGSAQIALFFFFCFAFFVCFVLFSFFFLYQNLSSKNKMSQKEYIIVGFVLLYVHRGEMAYYGWESTVWIFWFVSCLKQTFISKVLCIIMQSPPLWNILLAQTTVKTPSTLWNVPVIHNCFRFLQEVSMVARSIYGCKRSLLTCYTSIILCVWHCLFLEWISVSNIYSS